MERIIRAISVISVVLAIDLFLLSAGAIWMMATSPVPQAVIASGSSSRMVRLSHRPQPTMVPTLQPVMAVALRPAASPAPLPTAISPAMANAAIAMPPIVWRGNLHLHEVALTFDDGPSPVYTPQVLAVLAQNNVAATFFLIGQQAAAYPDLVRREAAAGNAVEVHSWSHPDLNWLSPAQIAAQLENTCQVINDALGMHEVAFFRPPYGDVNNTVLAVARQLGLTAVMWDVDPRDWARPGISAIINRVLAQVHNGSIILLHDGGGNRSQTVAALPEIIAALRQKGYTFVTVSRLLANSGFAAGPVC